MMKSWSVSRARSTIVGKRRIKLLWSRSMLENRSKSSQSTLRASIRIRPKTTTAYGRRHLFEVGWSFAHSSTYGACGRWGSYWSNLLAFRHAKETLFGSREEIRVGVVPRAVSVWKLRRLAQQRTNCQRMGVWKHSTEPWTQWSERWSTSIIEIGTRGYRRSWLLIELQGTNLQATRRTSKLQIWHGDGRQWVLTKKMQN